MDLKEHVLVSVQRAVPVLCKNSMDEKPVYLFVDSFGQEVGILEIEALSQALPKGGNAA